MSAPAPFEFNAEGSFAVSAERVFDGLTDLDAAREWMPDLVRLDRADGGAFGVGTTWSATRRLLGTEATEQFEVTVSDPPAVLEIRVDGSKGALQCGEIRFRYEVRSEGRGARVTVTGGIDGVSGLAAMIAKLLVGALQETCERDLAALAAYLSAREKDDGSNQAGRAIPR